MLKRTSLISKHAEVILVMTFFYHIHKKNEKRVWLVQNNVDYVFDVE